jgi:hypothetical protein
VHIHVKVQSVCNLTASLLLYVVTALTHVCMCLFSCLLYHVMCHVQSLLAVAIRRPSYSQSAPSPALLISLEPDCLISA